MSTTAVKEVQPDIFTQAVKLGLALTYSPNIEVRAGQSYPQELNSEQQREMNGFIRGIGELTTILGDGWHDLRHEELDMKWLVVMPEAPIVVVQPKLKQSRLLVAKRADIPFPGLHRSIDLVYGAKGLPPWNTTLGFDVDGHVMQIRENTMRKAIGLSVTTVEPYNDKKYFMLGTPSSDVPPPKLIVVFHDCQPKEPGFGGAGVVEVIGG
ncbi:MAG TPA: hypothetical protein VMR81_04775 [Patescibacteria group bacterium]|nr:hypothetical protein [Patescibacteria group bacterium]